MQTIKKFWRPELAWRSFILGRGFPLQAFLSGGQVRASAPDSYRDQGNSFCAFRCYTGPMLARILSVIPKVCFANTTCSKGIDEHYYYASFVYLGVSGQFSRMHIPTT